MQLGIFLLATSLLEIAASEYPACGHHDSETVPQSLYDSINDHVTLLLELRTREGRWLNPSEAALAIQLSQPESFYAINKTVNKMMEDLENDLSNVTTGQLAMYLLSVRSMCRNVTDFNGINLSEKLVESVDEEFTVEGASRKTPRGGLYGFFLALGAYCVTNDDSLGSSHLHRALHAQNRDGSFGRAHSVDLTAQALLSLTCLNRRNTLQLYQQNQIIRSASKASAFLLSQISTERDHVWIGDEYSSPAAIIAIMEHSGWAGDSRRCHLVVKSLDHGYKEDEAESAVAQRLMALKGVSYLSMMSENYRCPKPVAPSEADSPRTHTARLSCADVESEDGARRRYFSTMIDVHMVIHLPTSAVGNQNARRKFITLIDIRKGKTLLEILTLAECRNELTFNTETTSWGDFLTTVDGIKADSNNKEYWKIKSNGESITVGISQFAPSHADTISFEIERW